MANYTPMMEQYLQIKEAHQDAFLFFRLGDFYEMFFDDAIKASRELEITLTKRDGGQAEPIPMCGVPYHSAANYIKNLIEKGYKVAICEQTEDPKQAKGVVKREVIQMITPGTVMDSHMLSDSENNYIVSLSTFPDGCFAIAYNDLSTGENHVALAEDGWDTVIHELYSQPIREIVIASDFPDAWREELQMKLNMTLSYQDEVTFNGEYRDLCESIDDERLMEVFSRLLNYLQDTQKRALDHLQPAKRIELNDYLTLDMYSKRNLELTETMMKKQKHGSLLWVLDKTVTAMGSRLLKKWLERPLMSERLINERLAIVEGFYQGFMERDELRNSLKSIYDLERLAGRIAFGNVNARDLMQLKQSLEKIPELKQQLKHYPEELIQQLGDSLVWPKDIAEQLEQCLVDDPPISIKEGGIIKDGYHSTLDTYRDASRNGKQWIAELEQKEKQATNIKSLKIGYNRVFGYYIEVTKANLHLLPEGRYERKQTLTNAERYVTPELKEKEQLIMEAEEKSVQLEYDLFIEIRDQLKERIPELQRIAESVSRIDVLQGFATVSEANGYTRPKFTESQLSIKNGRHPVVEQVMKNHTFVPNDISLDQTTEILLITGPNMSGKSTYMRQLALTVIMGQIGCFVPCEEAELRLFDQIFTRIGAADDLVAGESTFMVEMLEANHALANATENSLILLDEIGRGTSTYDGMALAQAIVEYIHDHLHAKTLFSTHYHELTALEDTLDHLKNIHVRAEENDGNVVFLHQIQAGAADKSYGIQVAKLAELPTDLITRASQILQALEQNPEDKSAYQQANPKQSPNDEINLQQADSTATDTQQLSFFKQEINESKPSGSKHIKQATRILQDLIDTDLFDMTPIEAMNTLHQLQKRAKSNHS